MSTGPRRWLATLRPEEMARAAHLRSTASVDLAEAADLIWLRGHLDQEDALPPSLAEIPFNSLHLEGEDQLLIPINGSVPVARIPTELNWQSLQDAIRPEAPAIAMPAQAEHLEEDLTPIRIVRRDGNETPGVLCVPFQALLDWAVAAPAVRLQPLRFACSEEGLALVTGHPLPSIPGKRLVNRDGILLEAGWGFDPPVPASVLRIRCGLKEGDFAWFQPDGPWQWIEAGSFLPVSRAAIRRTARNLNLTEAGGQAE